MLSDSIIVQINPVMSLVQVGSAFWHVLSSGIITQRGEYWIIKPQSCNEFKKDCQQYNNSEPDVHEGKHHGKLFVHIFETFIH